MWCLLVSSPPPHVFLLPLIPCVCACACLCFPAAPVFPHTCVSLSLSAAVGGLQSNLRTSPEYFANSDGDTAKRSLLTAHFVSALQPSDEWCLHKSHSVLIIVPCASERMPSPCASTRVPQSVRWRSAAVKHRIITWLTSHTILKVTKPNLMYIFKINTK